MQLKTFQFIKNKGWSTDKLPTELDSPNTLIMLFAAPEFIDSPAPIKEIATKFPRSKMIGCSTAGEIYGSLISDHSISVAVIKMEKTPLKLFSTTINSATDSKL